MARSSPASIPSCCCWRTARPDNLGAGFAYVILALGSLLALFLYPHSVTGLLSSSSRHVIRRNAIMLPAYSVALALIALLGYMAVAAGVKAMPEYAAGFESFGNNFAVPALFLHMFPRLVRGRGLRRHRHRRAGAGLDHGDRLRQSFHPQYLQGIHRARLHARRRKRASPSWSPLSPSWGRCSSCWNCRRSYAIQLQLLGGIWICQTVPAVLLALLRAASIRWRCWRAGRRASAPGTWMAWSLGFKSSIYPLHIFGADGALLCRAERAGAQSRGGLVLSLVLNALSSARADETVRGLRLIGVPRGSTSRPPMGGC